MNVVIFGATGMVGKGVLLECLDDARVERVLLVSRHPIDISHPKLREVLHQDYFDFSGIQSRFVDLDACFFCLGGSSVGLPRHASQITSRIILRLAFERRQR